MRLIIRTLGRLAAVVAVLAAVVALGGIRGGPEIAHAGTAMSLASVKSCDSGSSTTMSVVCTITLNSNVASGAAWQVMIVDTSAMITACDGSAAGATCKTSNNTAEFDCSSSGCQPNSTYTVTVSATPATAMQESFSLLNAASTTATASTTPPIGSTSTSASTGGSTSVVAPTTGSTGVIPTITVGLGGGAATTTGTTVAANVTYSGPAYSAAQQVISGPPQGGACVGGSVPGPNGCTSAGPLLPSVGYGGYGGYGGCYGAYSCGGQYGAGFGSCFSVMFCSSAFGSCGSSLTANCSSCAFNLACTVSCSGATTCTLNNNTGSNTCRIFYLRFNC